MPFRSCDPYWPALAIHFTLGPVDLDLLVAYSNVLISSAQWYFTLKLNFLNDCNIATNPGFPIFNKVNNLNLNELQLLLIPGVFVTCLWLFPIENLKNFQFKDVNKYFKLDLLRCFLFLLIMNKYVYLPYPAYYMSVIRTMHAIATLNL